MKLSKLRKSHEIQGFPAQEPFIKSLKKVNYLRKIF
jgi:hypothetical protein